MRMTISFGSRNRKDGLLASKRTLTVTGYARPTLVAPFILAFTLLVFVDPVLSCCQRPPSALAKKPRPPHHLPNTPPFGLRDGRLRVGSNGGGTFGAVRAFTTREPPVLSSPPPGFPGQLVDSWAASGQFFPVSDGFVKLVR